MSGIEFERERSAEELAVIERIRETTRSLPEVAEVIDGFGHLTFRVGKKSFAMMGSRELHLAIKADLVSQDLLVRSGRFTRTPYIGQHGWVSVADFRLAEWEEIEQLLSDAYRLVAPKRLVKSLDQAG